MRHLCRLHGEYKTLVSLFKCRNTRFLCFVSNLSTTSTDHIMLPTTQTALVLPQKFGEFVLDSNISIPKPPAGEVLVKVKSIGLSQGDWKIPKLGIIIQKYPAIIGLNFAGEVAEVGQGVTRFKPGDRV